MLDDQAIEPIASPILWLRRRPWTLRSLLVIGLLGCLAADVAAAEWRGWQLQDDPDGSPEVLGIELDTSPTTSPYDEPLVTDRPDFTESSSTVGYGVVQLEMGYTFTYNDDDATGDKTRSHTAPEMLLRVGVSDHVELRFVWTYEWDEIETAGVLTQPDGSNDIGLGAKIDLYEQCGWWPEQAIIIDGTVPTGADAFSTDDVEVGVNYLYGWELPCDWGLGGSTGFFTDSDAGDDFVVWFQSVALGIPINDCWGAYVEYFGLYESERAGGVDQHFLNGGFSYLLSNDVQWDILVGFGLNADAADFFTGTGASFRF